MSKYNSDWIERNVYYKDITKPGEDVPHFTQYERPVILCLCGSTRFGDAYRGAMLNETLAGKIVLSVGCVTQSDAELTQSGRITDEVKVMLDELHLRKIDLADEVLVLNVKAWHCDNCGHWYFGQGDYEGCECVDEHLHRQPYIGESTRRELEYARKHGKTVRFLNPPVESEGG